MSDIGAMVTPMLLIQIGIIIVAGIQINVGKMITPISLAAPILQDTNII